MKKHIKHKKRFFLALITSIRYANRLNRRGENDYRLVWQSVRKVVV